MQVRWSWWGGEGNTDLLEEAPQRGETLGRRRALLRAGIGREHEHAQPEPPWFRTGLGLGLGLVLVLAKLGLKLGLGLGLRLS